MNAVSILIENLAILTLPLMVVWLGLFKSAAWLDQRNMYQIPLFHHLVRLNGVLVALVMLQMSGLLESINIADLWSIEGPWDEVRLAVLIGSNVSGISIENLGSITQSMLWVILTLMVIQSAAAILGWRSLSAVRGMLAGHILTAGYALAVALVFIAFCWVIHWLNFWIFLVALCYIELRRREDRRTRLSF